MMQSLDDGKGENVPVGVVREELSSEVLGERYPSYDEKEETQAPPSQSEGGAPSVLFNGAE
jgi:hypothetical protein